MTFYEAQADFEKMLSLRTASKAELEIEFAEYPQYMSVLQAEVDVSQFEDLDLVFRYTRVHVVSPFQLMLLRYRYDILEKLFVDFEDAPLRDVVRFGNKESFRFLRDTTFSAHYLVTAIGNPDSDMFDFLFERVNTTGMSYDVVNNLIQQAMFYKNGNALRRLINLVHVLKLQPKIDESNFSVCDEEAVSVLLENGVYPEKGSERSASSRPFSRAAYYASSNPDVNVLVRLTKAGILVERDAYLAAARNHSSDVMKELIRKGVSGLDSLDFSAQTPLAVAARWGVAEVVKLLVEAGANVKYCQHDKTLLSLAAENPDHNVMRFLIDSGALVISRQKLLLKAAEAGNTKVFFMLLEGTCFFPDVWYEGVDSFFEDEPRADDRYSYDFEMLLASAAKGSSVDIFRAVYGLAKDEKVRLWANGTLNGMQMEHLVSSENMIEMFARGILPSRLITPMSRPSGWEKKCTILISQGYKGELLRVNDRTTVLQGRVGALLDFGMLVDAEDRMEEFYWTTSESNWVHNQISRQQLVLLKARAMHVCTVLYECSALEQCTILSFAFWPMPCLVPFHKIWNIVTCVKHFKGQ